MLPRSLLAIAALLLSLAGCAGQGDSLGEPAAAPVPAETVSRASQSRLPTGLRDMQLSFAPVVERAAPAVVTIYTRKVVAVRRNPFMNDPFFREFFGDMVRSVPRQRVRTSLGSGVIVDPSGVIVSNFHVVAGADEIVVALEDGREFQGQVVFADEDVDLAIVRIRGARGLPALSLRDSDTIAVGDLTLAIGNPFGVGQTVTSGIVSGLARAFPGERRRRGFLIQTDAAINPGNSGGALVDMEGRLIGVPTAILSRSGGSNGIGFAVPANLVRQAIERAI